MTALKKFGIGILWALLFPIILAGVAIVGVFGAVDFVIEFIIMVVNFFRGKKLFPLYPEDEKAMEIMQRAIDKKNMESAAPAVAPQPQQVFVQQNFYTTPNQVPPPVNPGALPPGYNGYPGMNPNPLPPGYQQLPPQQPPYAPGALPPQQQAEPIPERPELAKLPEFDPSAYRKEPDAIDIDIDEGDEGNE